MNEMRLLREWDADAPPLTDHARARARLRLYETMTAPASVAVARRPLLRIAVAGVATAAVATTVLIAMLGGAACATERPFYARDIARVLASVPRALSVSSTRRRNWPPYFLTKSQLNKAVRAPPTWRKPVGEGANLSRLGMLESYHTWGGLQHRPLCHPDASEAREGPAFSRVGRA